MRMRLLLQIMKKKLKLDEISAIKKERKKDGNRQTNKVTNTWRIHQGTKGTPYHRTWENCCQNGVSTGTPRLAGIQNIILNILLK